MQITNLLQQYNSGTVNQWQNQYGTVYNEVLNQICTQYTNIDELSLTKFNRLENEEI